MDLQYINRVARITTPNLEKNKQAVSLGISSTAALDFQQAMSGFGVRIKQQQILCLLTLLHNQQPRTEKFSVEEDIVI